MFHYNEGTESALSIIARGMGENKENEEGKKVSVKLNQFFLFCLRREFIHRLQKKGGGRMRVSRDRLDLPFTSSSSMVVLESVDSFSFTCDPSLFLVIMLLPLHIVFESWEKEKKVDYDNEMSRMGFAWRCE